LIKIKLPKIRPRIRESGALGSKIRRLGCEGAP